MLANYVLFLRSVSFLTVKWLIWTWVKKKLHHSITGANDTYRVKQSGTKDTVQVVMRVTLARPVTRQRKQDEWAGGGAGKEYIWKLIVHIWSIKHFPACFYGWFNLF